MSTAALTRTMAVAVWEALAFLERAGGKTNCAILIACASGVNHRVLDEMAEEPAALITFLQAGTDNDPPRWLTSPAQTDARLTPGGHAVAGDVVTLAGALYWMSRRGGGGVTLAQLRRTTSLDSDYVAALLEHGMIQPLNSRGEPCLRSQMATLGITSKGRRYTTETD